MNIYIFKCSNGTYKIGKANDITQRKPQVEKEFGIKAEIYAWKPVSDTLEFEKMLHRKYSGFRAHHEFFNLTIEQVDEIVQKYCFTLSVSTVQAKTEITSKEPIHAKYAAIVHELETAISEKDSNIAELKSKLDDGQNKHQLELSESKAQLERTLRISNIRFDRINELSNQLKSKNIENMTTATKEKVFQISQLAVRDVFIYVAMTFGSIAYMVNNKDATLIESSVAAFFAVFAIFFAISYFRKSVKIRKINLTLLVAKPFELQTESEKLVLLHKAWIKDKSQKRLKNIIAFSIVFIIHAIAMCFSIISIGLFTYCFVNFSWNIVSYTLSVMFIGYFFYSLYFILEANFNKKAGILSVWQFNKISTDESIKEILIGKRNTSTT